MDTKLTNTKMAMDYLNCQTVKYKNNEESDIILTYCIYYI